MGPLVQRAKTFFIKTENSLKAQMIMTVTLMKRVLMVHGYFSKIGNKPLFCKYCEPLPYFTAIIFSATWNKDWKPGPFPRTQQEREAAAKKYGMRVEDYEPYPDDGMGYGDYPKLQHDSPDSRDGYQDWDIPEYKRNFGEPVSNLIYNLH